MSPMRRIFLETGDLASALERASSELDPEGFAAVRDALTRFGPRYEPIWREGSVPRSFLERFRDDPAREELDRLLGRVARFYDVDARAAPRPVVVLVPVPPGYGTHATAVGRYLLVEVRPPDRLADQASVIVHENSHFLLHSLDPARRQRLEAIARELPPTARAAWEALHEALPTALGQGVADRAFRPRLWSKAHRWYHREDVDRYAKALYPLVQETLERGGRFDERFVRSALALCPEEKR
jgi:hypothetical protein